MSKTELSAGWTWASVGEIGHYQNGRAFSDREWEETGRPIIRIQNLTGSGKSFNRFSGPVEERHLVRQGDLLVSWAATLGVFVWLSEEGALNQHIFKVTSMIDPGYHRYVLEWALDNMMRETHGSGMVHITKGKFDATKVPLAPFAEQKRIVGELERRLSHFDSAVAGLQAALKRNRALRKSILLEPLREPWPDHWERLTVATAGDSRLGLQRSPDRHHGENMKPYLKVANVHEDRIDLETVMAMHFTSEEEGRYRLKVGDILLNEGQSPEFLGRPAMWTDPSVEMYFTNSLIRFRCSARVDPAWALLVFRRHMHAGRFRRESRITTNIAHLALGRFRTVEFPRPPIEEQLAISTEIQRRLSLVDAAEQTIGANLSKSGHLRRSLLAAAFRGQLASQDPNDEPAEQLLERIRERRAIESSSVNAAKESGRRHPRAKRRESSA